MQLLKMPTGRHQCLVFSLAMLLDEDPDVLIQELGHNGMVKVWPEYAIPHCYNGHHIQEIIDLCLSRNFGLVPVELFPRSASALDPTNWRGIYTPEEAKARFLSLIAQRCGILIGRYGEAGHAVAWDGNIIFDPNGLNYSIEDFQPMACYLLAAITSEN